MEPISGWCPGSIKWLKENFDIRNEENFKVKAEIAVLTKTRIYLHSLKIVEVLNKSRIHVRSFDVKQRLIDMKFAKKDADGLILLTTMADKFGK